LAALVADDVLLVGEIGLVQFIGKVAHAIGFKPQSELELVGRERFVIVCAIKAGGAVEIGGTCGFEIVGVGAAGDVL
jgi:hypothetical protein